MEKSTVKGRTIFIYFLMFFVFIGAVNGFFIYNALRTHAGTVTDNPYEKGLSYNKTLMNLKSQPHLQEKAVYENHKLVWNINHENGTPLHKANVKVTFFRPIKSGSDFDIELMEVAPGQYEAYPQFPMKGNWVAQMDAIWDNKQYRTSQTITVK